MRALREFVIKPDGTQRRVRQHRSGVGDGKERGRKRKREREGKKMIRYRTDKIIDITGSLAPHTSTRFKREFR